MTDEQDSNQAEVEGQMRRANEEAEVEGQRIRANEEADPSAGEATTDDSPEVEGQLRRRLGPADAGGA